MKKSVLMLLLVSVALAALALRALLKEELSALDVQAQSLDLHRSVIVPSFDWLLKALTTASHLFFSYFELIPAVLVVWAVSMHFSCYKHLVNICKNSVLEVPTDVIKQLDADAIYSEYVSDSWVSKVYLCNNAGGGLFLAGVVTGMLTFMIKAFSAEYYTLVPLIMVCMLGFSAMAISGVVSLSIGYGVASAIAAIIYGNLVWLTGWLAIPLMLLIAKRKQDSLNFRMIELFAGRDVMLKVMSLTSHFRYGPYTNSQDWIRAAISQRKAELEVEPG